MLSFYKTLCFCENLYLNYKLCFLQLNMVLQTLPPPPPRSYGIVFVQVLKSLKFELRNRAETPSYRFMNERLVLNCFWSIDIYEI